MQSSAAAPTHSRWCGMLSPGGCAGRGGARSASTRSSGICLTHASTLSRRTGRRTRATRSRRTRSGSASRPAPASNAEGLGGRNASAAPARPGAGQDPSRMRKLRVGAPRQEASGRCRFARRAPPAPSPSPQARTLLLSMQSRSIWGLKSTDDHGFQPWGELHLARGRRLSAGFSRLPAGSRPQA